MESGWLVKWSAEITKGIALMMSPCDGDIQKPGSVRPDRFVAPPWRNHISRIERDGTLPVRRGFSEGG
jgi:hypothetical protein